MNRHLVGQNAGHLVVITNNFPAFAIDGSDSFRDTAVLNPMDDSQDIGVTTVHVHEAALVIELLDGNGHPHEP
jgi:hypothetical protein